MKFSAVIMELDRIDSHGIIENDIAIFMSSDELNQLRLASSLALFYLPEHTIFDEFLEATE